MLDLSQINTIYNEDFRRDPYPYFLQALQDSPIVHHPDRLSKPYSLFRYKDVQSTFKNWKDFSSRGTEENNFRDLTLGTIVEDTFISLDPPRHTRLRRLAQQGFLPTVLNRFVPRAEMLVKERMDYAFENGEIDLVDDFAAQITVGMISAILGLPIEDWTMIRDWTVTIANNILAQNWLTEREQDRAETTARVTAEMAAYFHENIAARKRNPKEGDLISTMMTSEIDGDRFSDTEIESTAILLLLAGNDTTTNLIANFAICMAKFPDEANKVRENLDLVPQAVEEVLRYAPSLLCMERFVASPVTMHGVDLVPGDVVLLWMAAANRDPEIFENPNVFDISRRPNRHISFAFGPHMCLGAPLARIEGNIAARAILSQTRAIELVGEPEPTGNSMINGPAHQRARFIPL